MSKKSSTFVVQFKNRMDVLDDTLYYALQGLETRLTMEYNCHFGWPCRQIVRTGIEVAETMLGDDDVEAHKESYYTLISRRMSSEPRETMMVFVVMRVLFGLIENDSQARRCRNAVSNEWGDEIEDIYHSYRRAVDKQIDLELTKQPNQIFTVTVMRTEQPQTVINVAGNYIVEQHIDIHDNPNATIYATAQEAKEPAAQPEPAQEEPHCALLTAQCVKEGRVSAVETELRSAASGSAQKLMQCIRTNEALGYIDTKNMSSQALYDELDACFGLRYKYQNFAKYRRD